MTARLLTILFAAIFVLFCATSATSQTKSATDKAQLEQGRYLVQHVAMCGDCHTPHDDHGQPIEGKALQGAGLTFKPLSPVPNWVEYAPPLAGLRGFTDDQMITFLTNGTDPSAKPPRPPMPAYRFNKRDAAAIVAYLRSLAPVKKTAATH